MRRAGLRRADHQGSEGARRGIVGWRGLTHVPSAITFYKWRSRYGGMEVSDARLKALEDDNRRLKKLLAETMLDASTLKEMLEKTLTPSLRSVL